MLIQDIKVAHVFFILCLEKLEFYEQIIGHYNSIFMNLKAF